MSTGRLLFAFLFIAGTGLLGQDALKKGSYSLSGEISFAQSTTKGQAEYRDVDMAAAAAMSYTDEEMVINFSPNATLFIADNFAAGLVLGYRYSEITYKTPGYDDRKDIYRPYRVGPVLALLLSHRIRASIYRRAVFILQRDRWQSGCIVLYPGWRTQYIYQ
jgi:hypothetical protein